MEEMIPLSANIFHAKGDQQSRTVAALDVALSSGELSSSEREVIGEIREKRLPATYECRGDLVAALRGDDTAAPLPPESAKGPTYLLFGGGRFAAFSTREAAIECAGTHGMSIYECVLDDPSPRSQYRPDQSEDL